MNIFIDTNIFLLFYHLSSDDLEELKKLSVLLNQKKVVLWLPEQTIVEFKRNRANKIADALKRLQDQRINMQFPQISKDYDEYQRLKQSIKEADEAHSQLLEKIRKDVDSQKLKADLTIQELFDLATTIPNGTDIIERARLRYDLGNPPGKKDSLGDAINWEALLETVPSDETLHFITDDKDYSSPLGDHLFDPFLLDEWQSKKRGKLKYYKRLSSFFKEIFPDIKLASELEKDLLIRELANSSSFAETHSIIAKLSSYSDFSAAQANEIVIAAVSNNQVYWIFEDNDIEEFLIRIVNDYSDKIDPDYMKILMKMLQKIKDRDSIVNDLPAEDDIPF